MFFFYYLVLLLTKEKLHFNNKTGLFTIKIHEFAVHLFLYPSVIDSMDYSFVN